MEIKVMANAADIILEGRESKDSRGRPTVEVVLKVAGVEVTGDVPAGASKGEDEAKTVSVEQAILNIHGPISSMVRESGANLAEHAVLLALLQRLFDGRERVLVLLAAQVRGQRAARAEVVDADLAVPLGHRRFAHDAHRRARGEPEPPVLGPATFFVGLHPVLGAVGVVALAAGGLELLLEGPPELGLVPRRHHPAAALLVQHRAPLVAERQAVLLDEVLHSS